MNKKELKALVSYWKGRHSNLNKIIEIMEVENEAWIQTAEAMASQYAWELHENKAEEVRKENRRYEKRAKRLKRKQ
jgi:predicted secreted protein